jgi:hypothetical protein
LLLLLLLLVLDALMSQTLDDAIASTFLEEVWGD